jgi:16S rRNA (uracil1498-N3)-methyltransferase
MTPRLHIDAPLSEGSTIALSEDQAHYLRGVMRLEAGDAIFVFNGRDGEFEARFAPAGKRSAAAHLGARVRAPAAEPDLWLIFAAVKRAALETIVQKAVELGAARLVPILTMRTHRERVNDARLNAIAIEAAEQCGRLSPPAIAPALTLDMLLESWPAERSLYFCDEAGDDPVADWGGREGRARPMLDVLTEAKPGPAALLIGPEGGFAPEERARLRIRDFVTPVTLGPRILRADTAAIVALALWQAAHGDLKRT